MTAYRLWPSTNGGNAVGFGGTFISGTVFGVSGGGKWLYGYWWWCAASGQSTAPVQGALWIATSLNTGVPVPGSAATSGTLVPGTWNYLALSQPIQLAPSVDPVNSAHGMAYIAQIGFTGAFPDTGNYWGAGQPGAAGISNGPLLAYSAQSGSKPAPWGLPQGVFIANAGSDPFAVMANGASGTDNFWPDVDVRDTAPPGTPSLSIWNLPDGAVANPVSLTDTTTADTISTTVITRVPLRLIQARYPSLPGAAATATWAGVYRQDTPLSGTIMEQISSPSWTKPAAGGWTTANYSGSTILPAGGTYKISVAGPASAWGPADASSGYFGTGAGGAGIDCGAFYVPPQATAPLAYEYNGNAGGSPPWSNGVTEPGQSTFAKSSPAFPYLYVDGLYEAYWADWVVEPVASGSGLMMASGVI